MSDNEEINPETTGTGESAKLEKFPELAELEESIRKRLRSNQRFLERFMDEDFSDLEDDEVGDDPEEPDQMEEL